MKLTCSKRNTQFTYFEYITCIDSFDFEVTHLILKLLTYLRLNTIGFKEKKSRILTKNNQRQNKTKKLRGSHRLRYDTNHYLASIHNVQK